MCDRPRRCAGGTFWSGWRRIAACRPRGDHPAGKGPSGAGIQGPCGPGRGDLQGPMACTASSTALSGQRWRWTQRPSTCPCLSCGGWARRQRGRFRILGASCHSAEEAREAEMLGCTYVTAGHIFATGCKPGLPPRGLEFLRGGLRQRCPSRCTPSAASGRTASPPSGAQGAAGACVMSGAMDVRRPGGLFCRI